MRPAYRPFVYVRNGRPRWGKIASLIVIAAIVLLVLMVVPAAFSSTPCTSSCVQPTPMPQPSGWH